MYDLGLKDKVILITGWSDGLGYASAELLSSEGAHVVICGRRGDYLYEKAKIITEKIKKPASIYIMRLPAFTDMHVHIDTYTKPGQSRRTIMMTLLSPRNYKEETRIEYYEQDKKTVTESHIYDDRAIITDPSVFHRCFNQTPEWRYSLQITWNDEVKDIIERLGNVNW